MAATRRQHAEGILAWSILCGVKLRLKDGAPRVKFPEDPQIDQAEYLAELKEYRQEIMSLLAADFVPLIPCRDPT